MFKKIKYILYKKGYLKLDTLDKKIDFILMFINNINMYSIFYRNKHIDFLEKDILEYINKIKYLLMQGLETKILSINNITESSYINTSFSFWYSNNKSILDTNNELIEWLNLVKDFGNWCSSAKSNFNNTYVSVNYRKLSPYYLNITNIVDSILEGI